MADKKVEVTKDDMGERELKAIPSSNCKVQSEGFVWREVFLRLPSGMTIADLHESPELFRNIQATSRTALRQWDHVLVCDFSEKHLATGIVNSASNSKVFLTGVRLISSSPRDDTAFQDETYRVTWQGSGYGVIRKADDATIGAQTFTTEIAAKAFLLSQYPRSI
jgi:hypothetical protein